ncbi:hypothetical protein IV203_003504 [Nitzschia inconspicua]|uniref:Uncharacterized protein n=1 Tax=Nitzschia inconspicua TaxID=303405 RepID=A0A9K3PNS7_9STRA|nr:hypothetical protein IV203_003504 [Nitzschia inconspicua]
MTRRHPFLLLPFAAISSSTAYASTGLRTLQEKPPPPLEGLQLPDWAQGWINDALGDVDWSSPTAWQDWLSGLMTQSNATVSNVDVCPVLELAIGMGQSFGIAADCTCEGDFATSLQIGCSFQQCLPVADIIAAATERQSVVDNAICGNVDLNFTLGGNNSPGSVATSVCTTFPNQLFQDTCFSYDMSVTDSTIKQTCAASYGGQSCDCTMDGLCMNLNCSSVLPGAAMDTCQWLKMDTERDFLSWIPEWDVFDSNFTLDADMIPWQNLDWDNLDWLNFNVSAIEWSSPDWLTESWTNLFGSNVMEGVPEGVCTFLETAVQLTEALGVEGSCKCGTTVSDGLIVDCDFNEICVDNSVGSVGPEPLCASVNMTLNYDNLAGVENEVCMNFSGDTHPETCFSYTIPFANQTMTPTCSATYGEGQCQCSIDENFCILVDCSEFEASAIMDTCQLVGLAGTVEAQRFMLPFRVPEEVEPVSEVVGIDASETPGGSDSSSTASELASNEDGSSAGSNFLTGSSIAMASISILLTMLA